MTRGTVTDLIVQALTVGVKVCLPLLLVGLIVGLVISVFQAVTQIQEMTLTFIPKLAATALVMVIGGPWMLDVLLGYATSLWSGIPGMVGP